jgi:hypothetical protein
MKIVMWQMNQSSKSAEEMNKHFAANNIPPIAVADSTKRTFRQAWVKFSSIHDKQFQAHRISDEEIAVVDRTVDATENILDLSHVASIYTKTPTQGNTSIYYKCYPKVCKHVQLLSQVQTNVCPSCGREIPEIAYAIIKEFNKRHGLVSTASRSGVYSRLVTDYLRGFSFLSTGRPFMVPDARKDELEAFKLALNEIGDSCYILDINEGKGDEGKLIAFSVTETIKEIESELDEIERPHAFENRVEKITELMDKVSMYETVLDVTKDQLLEKAELLKKKIREVALA